MTKALFFDIDGTLVSFETHRIPSSTIEALEAARAKGLKIFIATGRPKAIINNLSELQDRNLIEKVRASALMESSLGYTLTVLRF